MPTAHAVEATPTNVGSTRRSSANIARRHPGLYHVTGLGDAVTIAVESEPSARSLAILDAARACFARYGYRRTSVDTVARAAGCAKGTIYLYYRSKDALFGAVAEQISRGYLADAEHALAGTAPFAEKLTDFLDARYGYFFEITGAAAHAHEIIATNHALAAAAYREADAAYAHLLAGFFAEASSRGVLSPARCGLSPRQAAEVLIRCGNGTDSGARPLSRAAFRNRLALMVQVFFRGLSA